MCEKHTSACHLIMATESNTSCGNWSKVMLNNMYFYGPYCNAKQREDVEGDGVYKHRMT